MMSNLDYIGVLMSFWLKLLPYLHPYHILKDYYFCPVEGEQAKRNILDAPGQEQQMVTREDSDVEDGKGT